MCRRFLSYTGNLIGSLFVAFFLAYETNLLGSDPWLSFTIGIAKVKVYPKTNVSVFSTTPYCSYTSFCCDLHPINSKYRFIISVQHSYETSFSTDLYQLCILFIGRWPRPNLPCRHLCRPGHLLHVCALLHDPEADR